jgi:hypothetical protein
MAKKKAPRRGKNLFSTAAKDRSFKKAKAAEKKAAARSKKAWRKALVKAKRTIKKRR